MHAPKETDASQAATADALAADGRNAQPSLRGSRKSPAHHPGGRLMAKQARPSADKVKLAPIYWIGDPKLTGLDGLGAQPTPLNARKTAGPDQQQGGPRDSGCDGRWSGKKDRAVCSIR
jgi:hypothetical protein